MNSKEFVLWLKGFTDGVHEYNITPKQWDLLKEKLEEVKDEERIETPIGVGGWGTPNTFITPPPTDPYNPYKITCTPGTTITTTPGVTGHITISNPNLVSLTSGSSSTSVYNPNIGNWSYTTSNGPFSTQDNNSLKLTKQSKFKKRKAKSVKEWEDEIDLGHGE
jgi:hypothetical protein